LQDLAIRIFDIYKTLPVGDAMPLDMLIDRLIENDKKKGNEY
jgi:hypothetical protein